jgi:hypothetical protein
MRWVAWVVVLLVAVAVLVAVLPETTPEPVALADLNPGENPEVFGVEAEIIMMEGTITVAGIENPELSGLSSRLPFIVTAPVPTGPSLGDVSPYANPELFGSAAPGPAVGPALSMVSPHANPELFGPAAPGPAVGPALSDLSPYANPEIFGLNVGMPLVFQFPVPDPHESPEVLRATVPVLMPLWLISP